MAPRTGAVPKTNPRQGDGKPLDAILILIGYISNQPVFCPAHLSAKAMHVLHCLTLRTAAHWRRPMTVRELRANPPVEALGLATLGSVSTVAVALISAVALAVLGGA